MERSAECVVGVDLGGTNVRAQALRRDGSPAGERIEGPSHAQEGLERTLGAVVASVREAIGSAAGPVLAVGLAVPGFVDGEAGVVRWAPNFGDCLDGVFRYWRDVPLGAELADRLGVPVAMGNDANCAALGEYHHGVGEGSAHCLVLLTLGTGVGGGVVLAPRSLSGSVEGTSLLLGGNRGGAELGHITVQRGGLDCHAGSYGSLEAYCQRDAIVVRAQHKLRRGRLSRVLELVDGVGAVTPQALAVAADEGDDLALEVWREVGEALGTGIGTLINVFAPDVFAVGGQISKVGKWLLEPAIAEARNVAVPELFADCRIGPALRVDDAGLLGAASLAWGVA